MNWKGKGDGPYYKYVTLMFNISVKFHSDIPYSKRNYRPKTNSQINQGWITHNLER